MKFTFAITTSFENEKQLQEVYESIRSLQIPEYEILVIGGEKRVDEKGSGGYSFHQTNSWYK